MAKRNHKINGKKNKGGKKQSHTGSNGEPSSTGSKRDIDQTSETVGNPKKPRPTSSNGTRHRDENAGQGDPQPGAKLEDTQALVDKPGLPDDSVNKLELDGSKPPSGIVTDLASSGELESSNKEEGLPENSEWSDDNEDHQDENLPLEALKEFELGEPNKSPIEGEGSEMEVEGDVAQTSYLSTEERLQAIRDSVFEIHERGPTDESIRMQREKIKSLGYFNQTVMEKYLAAAKDLAEFGKKQTPIDNSKNIGTDRIDEIGYDEEELQNILQNADPAFRAYFDKQRKMMEEERKKRLESEATAALERKKRIVAEKAHQLSDTFSNYKTKLQNVYHTLDRLASFGQEQRTRCTKNVTYDTGQIGNILEHDAVDFKGWGGKMIDLGEFISNNIVKVGDITKFDCWRCDEIDEMIQAELKELNDTQKEDLQHICNVLNGWLGKSEVVEDKRCENGIKGMKDRLGNKELKANESNKFCPSMFAMEVEGSHASIANVVDAITKLGSPRSSAFSPSKKTKKNCRIPSLPGRKMRIVDLCIEKPGLYHLLMLDSALKLPVEIKPLFRKGTGPDSLDEECLSQVLGHLAKYLVPCMNFHSVGTSSFATGAICTLAYIKVVQMFLVMEEDRVELQIAVSKRLPLISDTAFDGWTKNDTEHKNEMAQQKRNLRKDLYEGEEEYSKDGIPKGMLVLRALVRLSRKSFFGPNFRDLYKLDNDKRGNENVTIDDGILGHGTYGVVLPVKHNGEERVLKAPAISSTKHIANEAKILTELGQASKKPEDFLSILEKEMTIRVELGSAKIEAKALLLSPRGKPLPAVLKTIPISGLRYYMQETKVQIENALRHMHNYHQGFVHNDVSPKNIIVVPNQNDNNAIKLCLVDFGTACEKGTHQRFFLGTREFAHDNHFLKYPKPGCTVTPEYDFFSLALTCCTIPTRGDPTWDMGKFPKSGDPKGLEEVLDDRRSKGEEIINEFYDGSNLLGWLKK